MMLATIYWGVDPILIQFGNFSIRYYSLCWLIGFALGYIVIDNIFIKEKINRDIVGSLFVYVFVAALIGARLGHCLFYDWNYFSQHPLEIILPITKTATGVKFTGYAGLASHGGALGVMLALFLFHKKYKLPFLSLLDKLALVSPLAGGFIRIGNFFNSEIIGGPSSLPWAVVFGSVDNIPRHPAQLYEAISYFIIFGILYLIYDKARHYHGFIFGLGLTLIFAARFVIEYCKEVQEQFELSMRATIGMDMGQLLSIPFILIGLSFIFFALRKRKNKPLMD